MEPEKVIEEEEEEEEKEHFFSDLVPSDEVEEDDDGGVRVEEGEEPALRPSFDGGASVGGSSAGAGGSTVPTTEQDRRAQIGASPYLAPFTPLSSPSRPKTPSSASVAQRSSSTTAKKPQLIPMKNGAAAGSTSNTFGGSGSKVLKDDVVGHLPTELVEALMNTVQTLDKLILGVEDYKADQLGFLYEKVNAYIDLLKRIDDTGANYHALIPLEVLDIVAGEENTNPELFTKSQLEKCQEESLRAAGKVDTLNMLKAALESGIQELE